MLNAVLWLTSLWICHALMPDCRDPNWNRNRRYYWQNSFYPKRSDLRRANKSLYSYPYYRALRGGSTNRIARPQFYPFYTLYSHPNFLLKHQLDNQLEIPPSLDLSATPNRFMDDLENKSQFSIQTLDYETTTEKCESDWKFEEFNPTSDYEKLTNGSFLKIFPNDTVIISPTILIGKKYDVCPHEWMLSNKPINLLVKKVPKLKSIYQVEEAKTKGFCNFDVLHKGKQNAKRKQIKCNINPKLQNYMENTNGKFPEIMKYTSNHSNIPFSEKKINVYPIKKKVKEKYQKDDYEENIDELIPDEEVSLLPPYRYKLNNTSEKMISDIGLRKRNITYWKPIRSNEQQYHQIPHIRHYFKRSCLGKDSKRNRRFKPKCDLINCLYNTDKYPPYLEYADNYDSCNTQPEYDDPTSIYMDDYDDKNELELIELGNNKMYLQNSWTNKTGVPYRFENSKKLNHSHKTHQKQTQDFLRKDEVDPVDEISEEIKKLEESPSFKQYIKHSKHCSKGSRIHRKLNGTKFNKERNRRKEESIIKKLTDDISKHIITLNNMALDELLKSKKSKYTNPNLLEMEFLDILNSSTIIPYSTKDAITDKNNYEHGDPVLDEMFSSPNKAHCESISGHRCVCSPLAMINFFAKEIKMSSDSKVLLKKLITYSCEEYYPIGEEYRIVSDMKPRLISKKRKELVEDEQSGPKKISPVSLDELMMRGIPREGVDIYIFPSTTVEIPCFTSDEMKLSPNAADSAVYRWSYSNLRAITAGRVLEDTNHRGSLVIQNVNLGDSDNYTCSVRYTDPDTQDHVKQIFVHTVKVVELPRLALHTNLHYLSMQKCDQELLEMFELYLPQQIEKAICTSNSNKAESLCSIEIHNPVCHTKSKQDETKRSVDPRLLWRTDFQKSRWIREILNEDIHEMEMSLNYELDLNKVTNFVSEALNWSHCSPHCQQKVALKTVEILRESFLDSILIPVRTNHKTFRPSISSINIKLLTACDGGLELKDGFCVPCKKHFYSDHGKTSCSPCPSGTYQDQIGAKSCIPCPHPFRKNCFSLFIVKSKSSILSVSLSIILLIVIIILCCQTISKKRKKAFKHKQEAKTQVKHKMQEPKSNYQNKPAPLPPDFE